MRKIFVILILFFIFVSCKTNKAGCDAYGNNNTKQTDKDRSDDSRNVGGDSTYHTKK